MANVFKIGLFATLVLAGFFCGAWMQADKAMKLPRTVFNSRQDIHVKKSAGVNVSPGMEVQMESDTVSTDTVELKRKRKFLGRLFKKYRE